MLLRVLQAVSRHRDRERVSDAIAEVLRSILSFDALTVKLHAPDRDLPSPFVFSPRLVVPAPQRWRSCVELPLVVHDQEIATLSLLSNRTRAYDGLDMAFASEVAAAVALALDNCLARERVVRSRARLDAETPATQSQNSLVAESPAMREVMRLVELVAPTDATVLIGGETGAGKERLARLIHQRSSRADRPMLAINCAAIPPSLIESELFGHEAGAFTGATRRHRGRFELAHGGTILLDEIGELALDAQAKLLRVLQNRELDRIGSKQPMHVDVRVIAATNRPLFEMVRARQFRDDLYYRLAVFPIELPPLGARHEDIPILAQRLVEDSARRHGFPPPRLDDHAIAALRRRTWRGNVRELQNLIERAVIWSRGGALDLAAFFDGAPMPAPGSESEPANDEQIELLEVLRECGWVIEGELGAARRLGLKPSTLRSRMRKLGIERAR
jgi:formate hydrogenlyase transcriptional activator